MNLSRIVVAVLFAASAGVFAIGVAVERSQPSHHDEPAIQAALTPSATAPDLWKSVWRRADPSSFDSVHRPPPNR